VNATSYVLETTNQVDETGSFAYFNSRRMSSAQAMSTAKIMFGFL
jgi:hypothetical protein